MKLSDNEFKLFLLAYKVLMQFKAGEEPKPELFAIGKYDKYLQGQKVANRIIQYIKPKDVENLYFKALNEVKEEYIKPLHETHLGISKTKMAEQLGINRRTLQRYDSKFTWAFLRLINEKLANGSTGINQ